MFIAALLQLPRYGSNLCPTTDEWVEEMWCTYTMEYYSDQKKKKILPPETMWMDLVGIMLSEINQTEKDKRSIIDLFYWYNYISIDIFIYIILQTIWKTKLFIKKSVIKKINKGKFGFPDTRSYSVDTVIKVIRIGIRISRTQQKGQSTWTLLPTKI